MINGASGVSNMNPGTSKKKKSSKKKGKKQGYNDRLDESLGIVAPRIFNFFSNEIQNEPNSKSQGTNGRCILALKFKIPLI